jgi:hypothetical protein
MPVRGEAEQQIQGEARQQQRSVADTINEHDEKSSVLWLLVLNACALLACEP